MERQKTLRLIRTFFGGLVILLVLGYSGFAAQRVFEGAQITLSSPLSGATFDTSLVHIVGRVRNAASLTLNGRLIAVDREGAFDEQLLLAYGSNMMELVATDRGGRAVKKTLQLFYQ